MDLVIPSCKEKAIRPSYTIQTLEKLYLPDGGGMKKTVGFSFFFSELLQAEDMLLEILSICCISFNPVL